MDEQMNNNGYQSQPNPMPNQNKDNYAVAILVLGIVSICCCAPCGIVALALRASSINDISPEKQGMVTAGFVTSIIGICLWGMTDCKNYYDSCLGTSQFIRRKKWTNR